MTSMHSVLGTPNACTIGIATLVVSTALLIGAPKIATAQRGSATLTGQMLTLQPLPAGMESAVSAQMTKMGVAVCSPPRPTGGPGPTVFILAGNWPSGVELLWDRVPGAAAYVVERAVDGTTNWIVAGSTCRSPDSVREHPNSNYIRFRDIAGGIRPGEQYVYKVTAIGAMGELGWNSFRWSPPSASQLQPQFTATNVTGSTLALTISQPCFAQADEMSITAPYGLTHVVAAKGTCGAFTIPAVVYGVPEGTHEFSVRAVWTQSLDPSLPRVVATSGSHSVRVTIRP